MKARVNLKSYKRRSSQLFTWNHQIFGIFAWLMSLKTLWGYQTCCRLFFCRSTFNTRPPKRSFTLLLHWSNICWCSLKHHTAMSIAITGFMHIVEIELNYSFEYSSGRDTDWYLIEICYKIIEPQSFHENNLKLKHRIQRDKQVYLMKIWRRSWVRFPAGTGPFCVEFACSPRVCVAFLRVLWFPPTIKTCRLAHRGGALTRSGSGLTLHSNPAILLYNSLYNDNSIMTKALPDIVYTTIKSRRRDAVTDQAQWMPVTDCSGLSIALSTLINKPKQYVTP